MPVIWTARDPMYGEVIGGMAADRDRQPLYRFGERLLTELSAPPRHLFSAIESGASGDNIRSIISLSSNTSTRQCPTATRSIRLSLAMYH
ncbi:MAG: hypothetical protein HC778_06420 [Chamaesiphon sp. CSU_1_12]|nr:hypothetical protein [Chamaesiphon sp. CSU_1_12]